MILETIVTTFNQDGSINASPMGPTIDARQNTNLQSIENFVLRPFDTSQTFANLKRTQAGVLHITDDVEMFARSAIGELDPFPQTRAAEQIEGSIIVEACRSYEFVVEFIDQTGPRMHLNCKAVEFHRHRDFVGFNRGKHAVLEAAILATRLEFLPATEISSQFESLNKIVKKTGGPSELAAIAMLNKYVEHAGKAGQSDSATSDQPAPTAADQGSSDGN